MNPLVTFMASPAGRLLRIALGVILLAWAFMGLVGTAKIIIAILGVVAILSGALDICGLNLLFGCPLRGAEVRAMEK